VMDRKGGGGDGIDSPIDSTVYILYSFREELDLATDSDDIDQRLKYAGIFHRRKRTPGRFMMRCVPAAAVWLAAHDPALSTVDWVRAALCD
jgi:hypothetical protein